MGALKICQTKERADVEKYTIAGLIALGSELFYSLFS
ncbi:hypothetical protein GECvBN3_gp188 [Salmonella phage GEC_vB_N3]|uniref:Uncharacterized protein n=2 Tax=Epseptimavirus TaxID=2732017 RepID=A0A7S9SSQ8_9CAUD|nr:hypothetical protein GECvBN3_gp188 [Salmonella phage GEC_vB_N3]QPI15631.1 hypothetical protein GECvBN7_gp188 [Salmonella phage GEC_vB_N7]